MRRCEFSPDRKYRYTLWREWDTESDLVCMPADGDRGMQYLNVIGLNPSTADETKDDPTIRRCVDFAKRWGFGALCMTNLFAFRSTYPRDLLAAGDPVGDENIEHLALRALDAGLVLAAWGQSVPLIQQRAEFILGLFRTMNITVHALHLNKDGSPQHPLYISADTQPFEMP